MGVGGGGGGRGREGTISGQETIALQILKGMPTLKEITSHTDINLVILSSKTNVFEDKLV